MNEVSQSNPTPSTQDHYYSEMSSLPDKQLSDSVPSKQETPYYTPMSALAGEQLTEPSTNQNASSTHMSALTNQSPLYANLK